MRQLKALANGLLALTGYTKARNPASSVAPPPTSFATPTDAIYARTDVVFEVPSAKCHFSYLFPYAPDAWNPFVQTLLEYGDGRRRTYEGSVLARYYERFQPTTTLDLFLGAVEQDETLRRCRTNQLTLDSYAPLVPWAPRPRLLRGEKGLDATHGSQAYGPVSRLKGQLEFSRLVATYDSIRQRGYRPDGTPDGDIRGYFLRHDDDYRFVVRAGFHRMAVLAALGHERIRVKFYPHYPRLIASAALGEWPQVKAGFMEPAVAKSIFLTFFEPRAVVLLP